MNKQELLEAMKSRVDGGTKKDADLYVNAFMESVMDELSKGGKVQLTGFGTFEVADRKEHLGRNPKTGEEMTIPARKLPKFKAGARFKEVLNK